MEAADRNVLTPSWWESEEVELRLPPGIDLPLDGLREAIKTHREVLAGHVIFSTSGSSGPPRLVCLSREALLASAGIVNGYFEITSEDRWMLALPTFHVGGFGILARAQASGAAVVSHEGRWNAEEFVRSVLQGKISLISLVPTQVHDLVEQGFRSPDSVRAVIVGGDRLPEDLRESALQLGWPVLRSYGMTETSSQIATERRPGSASDAIPVLPGWQVAEGAEGILQIAGPGLLSGWLDREDGVWQWTGVDQSDWFATQDLAEVSGEPGKQEIRVEGRAGRTHKILGELVNLDRLESLCGTWFPEQASGLALEVLPDARAGKRVVLILEGDDQTASEIMETINQRVAPFEQVCGLCLIPTIPRTKLGKIDRAALKAWLEALPTEDSGSQGAAQSPST